MKTVVGNIVLAFDGPMDRADTKLLLGFKPEKKKDDEERSRERVGKGKWMPGGGANEEGETNEEAACREFREEFGIALPVSRLQKVMELNGHWPWGLWHAHTYIVELTKDEINAVKFDRETFEKVKWFPLSKLPFEEMMGPDKEWMPKVIAGQTFEYHVWFDENKEREDSTVTAKKF